MLGASFSWLMCGKAPPDMPAFQPYRGKPAVRNDREGRGNDGIIRSPGSRLDSTQRRGALSNERPYRDAILLQSMSPLLADFVAKVCDQRNQAPSAHRSTTFILPLARLGAAALTRGWC